MRSPTNNKVSTVEQIADFADDRSADTPPRYGCRDVNVSGHVDCHVHPA